MDVYFFPAVEVRKNGSKEFRESQRELEGLTGTWEHMCPHVHPYTYKK